MHTLFYFVLFLFCFCSSILHRLSRYEKQMGSRRVRHVFVVYILIEIDSLKQSTVHG